MSLSRLVCACHTCELLCAPLRYCTAPQAPGRYLYGKDITPALKGKHAELFWPDDGMWYLIEIQVCGCSKKLFSP